MSVEVVREHKVVGERSVLGIFQRNHELFQTEERRVVQGLVAGKLQPTQVGARTLGGRGRG